MYGSETNAMRGNTNRHTDGSIRAGRPPDGLLSGEPTILLCPDRYRKEPPGAICTQSLSQNDAKPSVETGDCSVSHSNLADESRVSKGSALFFNRLQTRVGAPAPTTISQDPLPQHSGHGMDTAYLASQPRGRLLRPRRLFDLRPQLLQVGQCFGMLAGVGVEKQVDL